MQKEHDSPDIIKPEYYCWTSSRMSILSVCISNTQLKAECYTENTLISVDECTFCITFSNITVNENVIQRIHSSPGGVRQ